MNFPGLSAKPLAFLAGEKNHGENWLFRAVSSTHGFTHGWIHRDFTGMPRANSWDHERRWTGQDVGHVSKSREIKMVCVELMATKTNMGIYWVLFNCIYLPVRIRIVWDFFALTNGITWIMVFLRESNVWRATWNSARHCSVSIAGFCHHWTKWWMLSDATFEHPEGIYDY